jgi:ATP-binding cassette subfamily C protein
MFVSIWGSFTLLSPRQKLVLVGYAIASLLFNLLDLLALSILGLIGGVILGAELPEFLGFFGPNILDLVIVLLAIAALLFIVKTVAGIILAAKRERFLAGLEVYYSGKVADHIFKSDLGSIKKFSHARLQWLLLRSTQTAFVEVLGKSLALFAEVALSISIIIVFIFLDWVAATLVVVYFSLILLIFQRAIKRTNAKAGSEFLQGSVTVGTQVEDMLAAFKEISVSSRTDFFVTKFIQARREVASSAASQKFLQSLPRLILELGLIIGAVAFLAFEFVRTSGDPDLTLLSVFIVGSLKIMSSLLPIQSSSLTLRYNTPSAKDAQAIIREIKERDPGIKKVNLVEPSSFSLSDFSGKGLTVNLVDVSFSYSDRETNDVALDSISMSVDAGSMVALIGASGAGKSTLVDIVLGLHSPTFGHVLCSGQSPEDLRSSFPGLISYVPQRPGLITGSVLQNIALGIKPEDVNESEVWEAINQAEIADYVRSLPGGVHSSLGENSDALSGGQMQRIGLARALYTKPRLLVLDEATSALDAETEAAISKTLEKLKKTTTIIVVAHRLSTVKMADVVHVLEGGKIIANGTLNHLMENVPLVKRFTDLMSLD